MAATGAKLGTRTRFLREDPIGGGVYVAVAEVKSIGGPSLSRDAVEATHTESPDDHAEFIPGLKDERTIRYTLKPASTQPVEPEEILARAEQLREKLESSAYRKSKPPAPATAPASR